MDNAALPSGRDNRDPSRHRGRLRYLSLALAATSTVALSASTSAQQTLPFYPPADKSQAGRTMDESPPPPPRGGETEPPKGAPNIILILTDDVGYGASSTFGGPIPTPTMDGLAHAGLRYTEFHTTAICSPTRAALLTGRNHNVVEMGNIEEWAQDYDGYTCVIPKSAGTVAEILREHGYGTAAFGKWHLVPYREMGPSGPFDRWPTGQGFEYYYGFIGAQTNQWAPALYQDTLPIEPPSNDPHYILDRDLADRAIAWVREQKAVAPNKPFFIYYAPGTAHNPQHAPPEWIAKFRGKFDQGWDRMREETLARQKRLGVVPADTLLTPRPKDIPAWDSLPPERKAVYARMMEVHAAALAHADYQIGRLVQAVRDIDATDNTIFIYIQGDNGASAEGTLQGEFEESAWINGMPEDIGYLRAHLDELGGPRAENLYPAGWAWAMDAPFQFFKQIASHFGGTRNGMVISWKGHIVDPGSVRPQFHHVIDVTPTILDAAHIEAPAMLDGVPQLPLDGTSMVYTLDHPTAPSTRHVQYFNMLDNIAIYADGWVAATTPDRMPWNGFTQQKLIPMADRQWELYHVADDYSEAVDLAAKQPRKLQEMQALFWAEAGRNNALPIGPNPALGFKFGQSGGRGTYTYTSEIARLPMGSAPDIRNRSFTMSAEVTIPDGGAEGMLITQGGRFSGYAFYVQDGLLKFTYNFVGQKITTVTSNEKVPTGHHLLEFAFDYDGGGLGKGGNAILSIDGRQVGRAHIERTMPTMITTDESFDVGLDTGTPVVDSYALPFRFSGTLQKVTVTLR